MFIRKNKLCNQIAFVDGMWGTGKSILAPILGSYVRVEKQTINHNFEYLCTLEKYGGIDKSNAKVIIQLMADVALFNSMISREINLRPADDSGIINNPNGWLYIKRLFKTGGNNIVKEIEQSNPILHVMSHNILQVSRLLFESFGSKVKLFVMVRHPVYMAEHWYNYIDRVGNDLREFTLACGNAGNIPWFAENIDSYLQMQTMDKVIFSIAELSSMQNKMLSEFEEKAREQVLLIPFESFVLKPDIWLERTAYILGTRITAATAKMLKKQKCPRPVIHAGKGHKGYGFNRKTRKLSESDDYERRIEFIREKATSEALEVLGRISSKYATEYEFPREMPWDV